MEKETGVIKINHLTKKKRGVIKRNAPITILVIIRHDNPLPAHAVSTNSIIENNHGRYEVTNIFPCLVPMLCADDYLVSRNRKNCTENPQKTFDIKSMALGETSNRSIRYELARKLIHLSSVSIAFIYCSITKELALVLLGILFAGFLVVDLMKNFIPPLSRWYHNTFDPMLRKHELEEKPLQLNGATNITLSALLLVLFFPKIIAITCFAMVAVSDTMAALIGRKYGRHRFGDKSFEGSLAFLVTSLLIVVFVPRLDLTAGIITALAATLVEALPIRLNKVKIDDNLTIPIISALTCYLYYILFLPQALPMLEACP